jgi:putative teichuronic acid biosynthesis glycosyltransferase tuaG
MELISIIMPNYNGERFIKDSIDTILNQTYKNWELLIVDDCSKDKSIEIIKKSYNDKRIKLIKLYENKGSAYARNKALRQAQGRYIAFLDSDDLWLNNFLEEQMKFLKANKASLVYCSYYMIDENNKEILNPYIVKDKVSYKDILKFLPIGMLTSLYDTKQIGKYYFEESLGSIRDDYVYWLKILKNIDFGYANPEILARYRIHKNGITKKKYKMILPQFKVYYKIERLGIIKSLYYLLHWSLHGLRKYHTKKINKEE